MPDDVSTVTRIASLIATSPPEMRNDSFRGICRWVNTTLSIGLVAVIMLASLPATLRNPACQTQHITQPQGFQQVGTRRRLPRPVRVDKLPVVFPAIAYGSSLRGIRHDISALRLSLV